MAHLDNCVVSSECKGPGVIKSSGVIEDLKGGLGDSAGLGEGLFPLRKVSSNRVFLSVRGGCGGDLHFLKASLSDDGRDPCMRIPSLHVNPCP